jgi:hypothetical protein
MKIKKKDLIHLIREMALDEMAYMGMPNVQIGQQSPWDEGRRNWNLSKIEKFFKSKNYAKKATKFFGESRGFPGSNVWVIPQVGRADSKEFQFNKDEPGYVKPYTFDSRGNVHNISEKLLRALGMPEEDIESVDFAKDIIFVPSANSVQGGYKTDAEREDNYTGVGDGGPGYSLPTPHMLIHALYDGGSLSKLPEVERVRILEDYPEIEELLEVQSGGHVIYRIKEINDGNEFEGIYAPIAATLRAGMRDEDLIEFVNEILTGCLLYRGLEKIKVAPEYDAYISGKTGMGVKELLSSAVEASREFLKGKIVSVRVV